LSTQLQRYLNEFGYQVIDIRLSDLLKNFSGWKPPTSNDELERIAHLQELGDKFRAASKDGASLARAAIAEIRRRRADVTGKPDTPICARAYVLHQLKHPDEVDLLRRVYGPSFLLIAGHASRDARISELAKRAAAHALKSGQEAQFQPAAIGIVNADEKQPDDFGQNTRDTYPKADFFANLGRPQGDPSLKRFIDLIFGHPFHTPTPDEYAMYQATAASLRSSDENRQVGAVIVSITRDRSNLNIVTNADVIAVGMNEVPRRGGGFYWENESPDCRDQALAQSGDDRASQIKAGTLAELIGKIGAAGWLGESSAEDPNALAKQLMPALKGTQFMNIGEFSRPVHAEMAALIDSARRGVAVNGHSMYVTTFPCHNCAKHIIAAGIRRVIYLEPYPKSRTGVLYGEEIVLDGLDGQDQGDKVVFSAFSGVGPRQYAQLFSMSERGAKKGRSLKLWNNTRGELAPVYVPHNAFLQYLAEECSALQTLDVSLYQWDRSLLCPVPQTSAKR